MIIKVQYPHNEKAIEDILDVDYDFIREADLELLDFLEAKPTTVRDIDIAFIFTKPIPAELRTFITSRLTYDDTEFSHIVKPL